MVLSKTASQSDVSVHSTFASRYVRDSLPRFKMPENSIPKEAAYQIINDELMLDGNPRLNLASFVTTWMEPECDKLIMASVNKNYVDMDEYPVTTELQNRCVNMIAHLFNAPLGRRGGCCWCRHCRFVRSHNAGRIGVQEEMAEQDESTRQTLRQAQHCHGRQRS
ncbi:UNVERIFIED_CONTAM: Glutamate decarboxylase, partial [Sesamum latifolium]